VVVCLLYNWLYNWWYQWRYKRSRATVPVPVAVRDARCSRGDRPVVGADGRWLAGARTEGPPRSASSVRRHPGDVMVS